MPMSKNLGMYAGIKNTLDKIKANGHECVITFESATKAKHWRTRAYYFRKLLHEKQRGLSGNLLAPLETSTPYDDMIFRLGKGGEGEDATNQIRICAGDDPTEFVFVEEGGPVFTPPSDEPAPEIVTDADFDEAASLVDSIISGMDKK